MGKGTKAAVAYFNGAETGQVGKAQKGGASAGSGGKLSGGGGSNASAKASAPKGVPAGGTENLGTAAKSIRAAQPGSTTHGDANAIPAAVAKHGGLSASAGDK